MTQKTVRDLASFIINTYLLLGFSLTPIGTSSRAPGALRRAGTMVRSPMDGRREKEKTSEGDMTAHEVEASCFLHVAAYTYRD
jgi:exocyst complex component 1